MKRLLVTAGALAIALCARTGFASEAGHHWDRLGHIADALEDAADIAKSSTERMGGAIEALGESNDRLTDILQDYLRPRTAQVEYRSVVYLGFLQRAIAANFDRQVAELTAAGLVTKDGDTLVLPREFNAVRAQLAAFNAEFQALVATGKYRP